MDDPNHFLKLTARLFAAALLLAGVSSALADVRYVDLTSTNATAPYTNWATAATNIQDAVDAAVAGDEIVVTNGTYSVGGRSTVDQPTTTNRVVVDKPLALRSANGPQSTIIDGGGVFRCVYLTNGASLSGFTLTNGFAVRGAGVFCESTNAVVSNCVVSGNSAPYRYYYVNLEPVPAGGGAHGGTLNNCILSQNSASGFTRFQDGWHVGFGGGAANAMLNNCTLTGNNADNGGGAWGCMLNKCMLRTNTALLSDSLGGGALSSMLNNCTLIGNSGSFGGGAVGGTLNNCTLSGNSAVYGGGTWRGTLNNCTVAGNAASSSGGGASGGALSNCVVYFNTAPHGTNYEHLSGYPGPGPGSGEDELISVSYSCTTPLPTNGVGNITNEPAFVNFAAGNYRLRPDSPCIDAGTNLSASITNDIDGRPRPLDGNGDGNAAFDMGAYEYRTPLLVRQDSPNPAPPHADWATAAHTIQDAVDAAVAGDEIVVTNGIYFTGGRAVDGYTTNRVAVDKPLTLRSVNGPQFTTIDGGHSNRCVHLTNGASLNGFTLTNGRLVVRGATFGGGAYGGGTLNNCILSGNSAAYGGGAYGCTLNNCTLTGNSANGYRVPLGSGGFNGYGGGAYECSLNNCTLIGNTAYPRDLSTGCCGLGGGAYLSALNNCIVYFNTNYGGNHSACTLNYSCTTPLPNDGVGNITNAPLFVGEASGNLRLQSNSPCINAGLNAFAPAGPDLDGNPRIVDGIVDIGAYESPTWVAPQLTITSSGTNVILTWATNHPGPNSFSFTLQSTTNLVSPVFWSAVPPPLVVNGQNVFTEPASGAQRFYRLNLQLGPCSIDSDCPCGFICAHGFCSRNSISRGCGTP